MQKAQKIGAVAQLGRGRGDRTERVRALQAALVLVRLKATADVLLMLLIDRFNLRLPSIRVSARAENVPSTGKENAFLFIVFLFLFLFLY
jgi:hypothetical protein